MSRITTDKLQKILDSINAIRGKELKPYSQTENGVRANVGTFFIDNNPTYGGAQLCRVCEGGGATYVFTAERLKPKEMFQLLQGMLWGLQTK